MQMKYCSVPADGMPTWQVLFCSSLSGPPTVNWSRCCTCLGTCTCAQVHPAPALPDTVDWCKRPPLSGIIANLIRITNPAVVFSVPKSLPSLSPHQLTASCSLASTRHPPSAIRHPHDTYSSARSCPSFHSLLAPALDQPGCPSHSPALDLDLPVLHSHHHHSLTRSLAHPSAHSVFVPSSHTTPATATAPPLHHPPLHHPPSACHPSVPPSTRCCPPVT